MFLVGENGLYYIFFFIIVNKVQYDGLMRQITHIECLHFYRNAERANVRNSDIILVEIFGDFMQFIDSFFLA